jgi:hypothetical protein
MNHRAKKYRDTHAAPGSQLYAALEAGDKELAERIYQQCERERIALEGPRVTPVHDKHCQNGWADFCLAGRVDGIACPFDSCDIDDGIRSV